MQNKKYATTAIAIFGIFLSLSYLHPYHIHPYRTYYHDAFAIIGLLLAVGCIALDSRPKIVLPSVMALPIIMIATIGLQSTFGLVAIPQDILFPILYLMFLCFAITLGATYANSDAGTDQICFSLSCAHAFAALLSVGMQILQISGAHAMPYVMYISKLSQPFMRPYANVAQPNQLALLLCFGLASVWFLYQRQFLKKWISLLLVVIFLLGLALTQSRIGWIILPVFSLLVLRKVEGQYPINRWIITSLVSTYVCFVFCLPSIAKIIGFATGSIAEHIGGRSERLVLIQQAWTMAVEHPIFGVGWFGFSAEQVRIAADFDTTTYAEHSHNLVLNLLAELGLPVALVLIVFGVLWVFRTCIFAPPKISTQYANLFFVAVLVHSMVEFPLWYAYVLIPIGILIGVVHQSCWTSVTLVVPHRLLLGSLVVLSIVLLLITYDYHRVTAGFQILRWQTADKSIDVSPPIRPRFTLFPQFFDYFAFARIVPREGMSSEEIVFAERVVHRFAYVHMLNKLAEIYTLNGATERATRTMLTLQRLHPLAYSEYYDYWKVQAAFNKKYAVVFDALPFRNAL